MKKTCASVALIFVSNTPQGIAASTSSAASMSTDGHYRTLPGRRSSSWPTRVPGLVTSLESSRSPMDASPRYLEGIYYYI